MRNIKKEVLNFLVQDDFAKNIGKLHNLPSKKLVNTLFSFLCSTDKTIKNRTATAFGEVVSKIAEDDIAFARTVMRRLMLSLTEESGGIGWGAPVAMGEIMARSEKLAEEYHKILISYTMGGGNELDFEELQKDVIAGLKRLSGVYPELVKEVNHLLK
ncbi:MAG: hypothetical protein KJO12_00230 [Ignavibacteria bacterium]|nr:hypothetical protein [Ignavibacteria bacterium]